MFIQALDWTGLIWYGGMNHEKFFGRSTLSQIIPEGEAIRNAVKWISSEHKEDSEKKIFNLIQQASSMFNLSPREEEFLNKFYSQGEGMIK